MPAKITRHVLESYLNCKYKGYLKLTDQEGAKSDYENLLTEMRAEVRLAAIDKILARHPGEEIPRNIPLTAAALKQGAPFLLDATLEDDLVSVTFDGLIKADGPSKLGQYHYIPILFHEGEKIGKEQKLLLECYGLLLSHVQGQMPVNGIIWHGKECKATRVRLNADLRKTERILRDLKEMTSAEPPPKLMLNDHCQVCEFRQRCHAQAVQEDNLSLLRGMGQKEIKACNQRGIFSVTQLSYTFRPKRLRKRTAPQTIKHNYALQARAIRDNSIYVAQRPLLPSPRTSAYLDVEGDSQNAFYYLIGLNISDGTSCQQHSLWANKKEDERLIWTTFLSVLGSLEDFTIYHYGSYEVRFFKKMSQLYGGDATLLTNIKSRMFNVLSVTYNHIYFPVYSNGLKAIATWLNFQWSATNASGQQCLVWHNDWNRSGDEVVKETIVKYNQDDCMALATIVGAVQSICDNSAVESAANTARVVNVEDAKSDLPYVFGRKKFCSPDLDYVRKHSYFDYQMNRIYLRTKKKSSSKSMCRSRRQLKRIKISKCVVLVDPTKCPKCGSEALKRGVKRKRDVIDLRFSSKGVKSWVVRYIARQYSCEGCGTSIMPRGVLGDQ